MISILINLVTNIKTNLVINTVTSKVTIKVANIAYNIVTNIGDPYCYPHTDKRSGFHIRIYMYSGFYFYTEGNHICGIEVLFCTCTNGKYNICILIQN